MYQSGNKKLYVGKNNRHFEQYFQDSQQSTINQNINYEDKGDLSLGKPIQLIRFHSHHNQRITIDEQALDIIASCDMPVGFVCLAGKYRTGKSFLLNKLLMLEGDGFKVDSSVNACTEGIWMWSKPILNEQHGNYIFFLDTQGSGSLNRNTNIDAKIFTLATLISSYLIYNSVGGIDEKSISEINMVTQLSRNIILSDNTDLKNNEQNLYKFMPKFLWLLRDFILQPQDQYGKKLTPNQYLQDALFNQNHYLKTNQGSHKIRRSLLKYFKQRQCFTLVRPAKQQSDIEKLNYIPSYSLRREFIEGVNKLRQMIIKNAGPKIYEQNCLYGNSIVVMLETYVDSMNSGSIPSIKSAWQSINDDEGVFAYQRAVQQYQMLYQQNFQQQKPKGEQIYTILRYLRQAALSEFKKNLTQPNQAYQIKLKQLINQNQDKVLDVNKQLSEIRNKQILRDCTESFRQKLIAQAYNNQPEQLVNDANKAVIRYNERARGYQKGQILSQFVCLVNPLIWGMNQTKQDQGETVKSYKERQYQNTIKTLKQKVMSLQKQRENNKQSNNNMMEKTNFNSRNEAQRIRRNKKKNADQACCGGDNCIIM